MRGIPPVLETDSEDVAWALQTADALWLRNERVDAVVWLRRAAQAAGDSDDNERALVLARAAAELSDWMSHNVPPSSPSEPAGLHDSIEELLSVSRRDEPRAAAPSAAEIHAGMLHPWTDDETRDFPQAAPLSPPPPRGERPIVDDQEDLTETVTAIGDRPGRSVLPMGPNHQLRSSAGGDSGADQLRSSAGGDSGADQLRSSAGGDSGADQLRSSAGGDSGADQLRSSAGGDLGAHQLFDDDVITSAKGHVIRSVPGPLTAAPQVVMPPPVAAAEKPAERPASSKPRLGTPPSAPKGGPPRPPPPPLPQRKPPVPAPAPVPPPVLSTTTSSSPGRISESDLLSDSDLVTIPPAPLSDSQTIHLPPGGGGPQDSTTTRVARERMPSELSERSLAEHVVSLEDSVETSVNQWSPDLQSAADRYRAQQISDPDADETAAHMPQITSHDLSDHLLNESGTLATTSSVRMSPPLDSSEDLSDLAADPSMLAGMTAVPERVTDRPVAVQERGGREVVELTAVDALSDIPDDEREAFAARATLHDLTTDEEVFSFALALVMDGAVDVVATVLDAAEPLPPGTVLRSRGTNEKGFELRLVCRSDKARVATWPSEPVEAAFKSCPWVEDDLRIATDRIQALVGITSGPLADRLDAALRQEVVGRMTTRAIAPHEVLLNKGETVPGLYVVGVGGLEIVDGDKVTGTVIVGDFVFPTEVLGAGAAPATIRAPADGAVVLFAERRAAQELLVTCPPLLEILAGM